MKEDLRKGQMWDTSEGRMIIMSDPEENLAGGHNVLHARDEGTEGWLYSRGEGPWSIGPDADEVKFHKLFHDRRHSA